MLPVLSSCSFTPLGNPFSFPFLQMRKGRFREVKCLGQGPTARRRQTQDWNLGLTPLNLLSMIPGLRIMELLIIVGGLAWGTVLVRVSSKLSVSIIMNLSLGCVTEIPDERD